MLPWSTVQLLHNPSPELVVNVEKDRKGQQEEADEDPAVVDQHVFDAPIASPEQEQQKPDP